MKKRIISVFLTVVLLLSSACIALAAGGVELPMIPIVDSTFAVVKLSSNADGYAYSGDNVVFTTSVTEIKETGFSKLTVVYTYSDGLEFNNDVRVIGLPDGWEVADPVDENNTLTVVIEDTQGTNAVTGRSFDFTFSFTVGTVSGSQQSVNFSKIEIIDADGEKASRVSKKVDNNTFTTQASIPTVNNIGASLRINNTPALRFGMTVSKDDQFTKAFPTGEFVYSASADMKFGMLIIEESRLTGELSVTTSGAIKTIFEEAFQTTANEVVFAHTIDNVSDYTKNYVFRPFVMYRETSGGAYQYSYGEVKTRSARQVAQSELLIETSNKKIEMLNKFVD